MYLYAITPDLLDTNLSGNNVNKSNNEVSIVLNAIIIQNGNYTVKRRITRTATRAKVGTGV
jgi:hypothetical protein